MAYDWCTDNSTTDIGPIISRVVKLGKPYVGASDFEDESCFEDERQSKKIIVHYDTSAMKRFLTSASLQHEPKASDVITLVKKTFVRTSFFGF